ncbi:hypothetical protein FACS1894187_13880 [Synergistales bacterium]|nr:hypothetical protein FACS1894187_13880 [Synergistales bacterium]
MKIASNPYYYWIHCYIFGKLGDNVARYLADIDNPDKTARKLRDDIASRIAFDPLARATPSLNTSIKFEPEMDYAYLRKSPNYL